MDDPRAKPGYEEKGFISEEQAKERQKELAEVVERLNKAKERGITITPEMLWRKSTR